MALATVAPAKVAIIRGPAQPPASRPVPSPHVLKRSGVLFATFSPDGRVLATIDDADHQVHFWDPQTGEEVNRFGVDVAGVTFSGDGSRVLTWGGDSIVRIFDARTGKALRRLQDLSDPVRCAALSHDGARALAATSATDGPSRLGLWDATTGQLVANLDTAGASPTTSVAFSNDGKQAASLSGRPAGFTLPAAPGATPNPPPAEIALRLWNLDTQRLVRTIDLQSPGQTNSFSESGKLVLVTLNNGAKIFDAITGQELDALPPAGETFNAGLLTADRRIGLSKAVGVANLISATGGEILRPLEGPIDGLPLCHTFSQTGQRIILGTGKVALFSRRANEPGKVYVYDVASGKRLAAFDGHAIEVTQVGLAPDALHAFSRDAEKTLFLWSLHR